MPTVAENKKNTNSILSKIINIQSKVLGVKKNQTGSTGKRDYKYEDLNSIIMMLHPYLSEHGLGVCHTSECSDGVYIFKTTVFNETDSYSTSSIMDMSNMASAVSGNNIAQAAGSLQTYFKRYNLKNLFNLFSTDDDAAILTIEPITPAQHKQVIDLVAKIDDTKPFMEWLIGTFDVSVISDLSKSQASQVITALKTKVAKNA